MKPSDIELVVFLTRGGSLAGWEAGGLLERELALYRRLRERLRGVTLVSWGGRAERDFRSRLGGIRLVCNTTEHEQDAYLARLHRRFPCGRRRIVVKSNQIYGADAALGFARRIGRPFVARCGYLLSDFTERRHGIASPEADAARALEKDVFRGATRGIVTTPAMRERVVADYGLDPERVAIVPNYVDTDLFAPDPSRARAPRRILFVGRLEPQKNLPALVRAAAIADAELEIVGEGLLRASIETLAAEVGARVRFLGALPNAALPERLREASLFVLPSLYEGHPKTLLEAMSAGTPVVGTRVPGIAEAIADGETGLLAEPEPESLAAAISGLLDDRARAERLGAAARATVLAHLALDVIEEREVAVHVAAMGDG
ncbi:glycosyltransferase family 4 protein [Salinarimonas sp.]|uniref:glycosyltransferase family 4 protein n=1 Tax=Salinarimonas sp. TaxID=2766526 RepID=UPI00391BF84E